MDFLHLPLNPLLPLPRIEIPDPTEYKYDGDKFLQYPDSQGWGTRRREEWIKLFDNPPRSFVVFLERWFLFGMLHGLFGSEARIEKFIRHDGESSVPVLTMEHLPGLFDSLNKESGPLRLVEAFSNAPLLHLQLSLRVKNASDANDPDLRYTKISLIDGLTNLNIQDPRSPMIVLVTTILFEMMFNWLHYQGSQPVEDKGGSAHLFYHP
ncbi:hypothetical protein N7457_003237 [Penicillium paradoxum]|uniref:uncharacterized protein n=1 Tax=Penicillium paradoxum TaxID=176176 RepID=UPI002549AC58|nr:uncharacterized protein N7457_003237 [Penicillium paradoxum]KAJ5788247.1 hypothetical protein N7457_003237 [Penicillium paradoxum]